MERDIFYRAGEVIYCLRWWIIALIVVTFAVSLPILPNVMKPFTATGFFDKNSESYKANKLLNKELGYSYNRFVITYSSPTLSTNNPKFFAQIKNSLSRLNEFKEKHHVILPDQNNQQVSSDKHTAYAVVMFESNQEVGHEFLTEFESFIKQPRNLTMKMGGEPVFLDDVSNQTQADLNKAEYIGTPAAIVTLLIIFGSVIAAFLPICLGVYCAALILATLYGLGHVLSLSIFTINIALLVGLCISLDYALFFISRFRDQINLGQSAKEAVAVTLATAGKAIFFSGLAVFISMSALLLFPINILCSVGFGGLTAVFVAVVVALIILPAVLAVLDKRINSLSVRFFKLKDRQYWRRFITLVVKYPISFFCLIMAILLTLSYPVLSIKLGISNFKILPKSAEIRQFYTAFDDAFGENQLTPILVTVHTNNSVLSSSNISRLYDFVQHIKKDPRVHEVNSIVSTEPLLAKKQYQMLYQMPQARMSSALKDYLKMNNTNNMTVVTVISKLPDRSSDTKNLIRSIRLMQLGGGMTLQVTGGPANTLDVLHGIYKVIPYAFLWIIIFSYIILLVLLRSVVLPLKAIITTTLSLTASYGILVFVIQKGHFHQFLNFEPQGMLDISLCIIIICALFGFSMDYEVFLLARIKECYEKTGNTMESIISGIDQSGRIITSAAVIVILICYSFMFADILIVKAFGLGIAAAIFVDAFLIRLMLVPAAMALLNKWNWYMPSWLDRILPRVFFDLK